MIKTKRTLLSMLVFLIVFCLSAIFNIQSPLYKETEHNENAREELTITSDASVIATQKSAIQSLSYKMNAITIWDDEYTLTDDNPVKADTEQENTTMSFKASEAVTTAGEGDEAEQEQVQPDTIASADTPASSADMNTSNSNKAADTPNSSLEALGDTASEGVAEPTPEPKYSNIAISIAKDYVNIRKDPSTDSEVLGKLYRDSAAEIISKESDWYLVESGSVKGYVKEEFLKTGIPDNELMDKYGTLSIIVKADGLNVRKKPDQESEKLTVIYQNETYPVEEQLEEWLKVNIADDNVIGYVKQEYAELAVDFKDAVSKEEEEELLRIQAEERAKKETEVKYRDEVNYSSDDLKLLACLIHAEAGTQSYEGKLAVANIVLNRVKSSKYPDTIKAVIYQPGQFSVARSGSLDKQLSNYANYSSKSQLLSLKAAKAALEGANNIGSRLYFHSYRAAVRKGYDEKSTSVKIEDHLFW